jgi:gliding motility-associated-like protein
MGFSLMGIAQTPTITSFTPAYGAVGTLVTITGTNLTSPTSFTIGGANAIIVSNTGSSLVGMVMPGAITGNVSVTTAGGTAISISNFTVMPTPAPNTQQGNKLVGTGGDAGAGQGISVAISADGNTAVVGGYGDNNNQGAIWIYTRTGGVWTQQGSKLVGTGGSTNANQGIAVAINANGNTVLSGAYSDGTIGATWVFTRTGTTWTQQGAKLVGSGYLGSSASQGSTVSLSADGNTAAIGGYADNDTKGAIWVFTRTGSVWTQQGNKLVGTGANNNQALVVALSADGNTLIESSPNDASGGAVWIFTRSGNVWTQQGNKLTGTGSDGNATQGSTVAINADGNTILIGANSDNSNIGAAWVFTRTGTTWTQQGNKLVGSGNIGGSSQGSSVALSADGNTAILGANGDDGGMGAWWAFKRNGSTWTQQGSKHTGTGSVGPGVPGQGQSISLSADGYTLIEGGLGDNDNAGAAWVFKYVSDNADLSSLVISPGTLAPAFDAGTIAYTASVSTATSSITVTSVSADANATIGLQLNGAGFSTVSSGAAASSPPLLPGSNTINVRVTAQDGTTIKTYTITVTRLTNQTITFGALTNRTYGDAPFNLTATGGASGNAVTYISSNPLVATVSGNTVTIVAAGNTNITASQAGNAAYNAATDVIQPLVINKKTIAVTADPKNKTYGDTNPALTYAAIPALVGSDTFSGSLIRIAGEDVGTYAINQNTLALNNNYTLNYTGAILSITTKTITVTADAKSKAYGDADPALTYTSTPALIGTDVFTGFLTRTAGENVGTRPINQNTLALSSNYVINYTGANLTIGAKTINVTADAQSKIYGDADPTLTYTNTPALTGTDVFTGSLTRTAGEDVGTHAINQNTLALSSNYILNYISADLTITAKTITVTADAQSKTYGDADPALTYTSTPALVGADNFTGVLSRANGENIGTHAINQNSLALSSNYILNYTGADLTIGKKTINVTADTQSKTYGDADPALTYTSTPALVGADNFAGFLTRTAGENVGPYAINQNTLALGSNYVLNYTGADLTISANTQTISFSALADKLSTDAIFTLTATATSGLDISYTSSDATIARIVNGNQVEILKEGTVTITASQDGNGNYTVATPVSQQLTISNNPVPVIVIESNKGNSINKGETVALTASGADTYQWTTANGIVGGQNTAVLIVRPSTTTTYTVTGTTQFGRSSTQTFTIEVTNDLKTADATNILTPDGDGVNDYWIVKNIDMYPNNEVKIFDRTGRLVYSKKNYDNTWGATLNGAPLAEGTYYYIINYGNDTGIKKGFITIVRRK